MEWSGVEAMTESRVIVERYDEYGVPMWEGKGRDTETAADRRIHPWRMNVCMYLFSPAVLLLFGG